LWRETSWDTRDVLAASRLYIRKAGGRATAELTLVAIAVAAALIARQLTTELRRLPPAFDGEGSTQESRRAIAVRRAVRSETISCDGIADADVAGAAFGVFDASFLTNVRARREAPAIVRAIGVRPHR